MVSSNSLIQCYTAQPEGQTLPSPLRASLHRNGPVRMALLPKSCRFPVITKTSTRGTLPELCSPVCFRCCRPASFSPSDLSELSTQPSQSESSLPTLVSPFVLVHNASELPRLGYQVPPPCCPSPKWVFHIISPLSLAQGSDPL